jgi:GNAT superfamily N-acetyltransferase
MTREWLGVVGRDAAGIGGSGLTLLERIDAYCDAVPRAAARVEERGRLRLFVNRGVGIPYYARPLPGGEVPTAGDIAAARARQRELGVPEAFEWIHDLMPELLPIARRSGLDVLEAPLMALGAARWRTPEPPPGITVRLLEPGDAALAAAQAVGQVGFAHGGTAPGDAGPDERDLAAGERSPLELARFSERLRRGLTRSAVAEDAGGPLASGSHLPVDGVSEIVGVATLPSARRRGLAALVTAALVEDARRLGVELLFLSAGSEEIARVYARLGFERVGTACIAGPPA